MAKGRIIKSVSGFYYVESQGEIYQTRARGVFRNQGVTPLVGDFVEFESTNKDEGYILSIEDRKNELVRPPIANIDYGIVIASYREPDFSSLLLDRMLAQLEYNQIDALIYLTKEDLLDEEDSNEIEKWKEIYEDAGYFVQSVGLESDLDSIRQDLSEKIAGKTAVFMGQSGAGKSTLLNQLDDNLDLHTAEISTALGRGRHTTRTVQLLPLLGGWIADTPGFSSLELATIDKQELPRCFPEFVRVEKDCKFRGCLHIHEPKCQVKADLAEGLIALSRYENYQISMKEIEERKPRY